MLSSGIVDFQTINWQLAIVLFVVWMFVFLCSFKGVKTSGKVTGLLHNLSMAFTHTVSGRLFHNHPVLRDNSGATRPAAPAARLTRRPRPLSTTGLARFKGLEGEK